MKIKENITLADKINAIESIVSSYFTDGEYTPYYSEMAEVTAVVTYFMEDVEADILINPYNSYLENDDLSTLVNAFTGGGSSYECSFTMRWVRRKVNDKVSFIKDQITHTNPDLTTIVDAANIIIESLGNFSKLNMDYVTPENMELGQKVMRKIAESNVKITPDVISDIIKKSVDFDMDKATADIIDAKNAEIKELRKYKMMWDSRNISQDK